VDGREYGDMKTTLCCLGNINNEQLLHKIKIHNPNELWAVSVFKFVTLDLIWSSIFRDGLTLGLN